MKKFLVFTDLDGSLLDHDDYSWSKAVPALNALAERSFPVIFTSSKTMAEIINLKKEIGNYHPFICENGSVASIPLNYFEEFSAKGEQQYKTHLFGKSSDQITSFLHELRNTYHYNFRGFSDMDVDELVEKTGLDNEGAKKAKQREASEPLQWMDTETAFKEFIKHLETNDLIVTSGGRFFHVMSDVNKGQTVSWLIQKYRNTEPETEWITVGLGDSFNDIQMLEAVDYPVFISNNKTRQPDLSRIDNLQRPQLPGPAGWNQAILNLITKTL